MTTPLSLNPMLQSSLLGFIFTTAIAVSVSLRAEKTRREKLFLVFAITVGVHFLMQFLYHALGGGEVLYRLSLLAAVLVPQGALGFFRAFLGRGRKRRSRLSIFSWIMGGLVTAATLPPLIPSPWAGVIVMAYVASMIYASLYYLYSRSRKIESRVESTRILYLVFGGTLAATLSLADYLSNVGVPFPPAGAVLTAIFLYILSQALFQFRLLDLYELLGGLTILVALALVLAGIFWALVKLNPTSSIFFVNAMGAAFVILIVFDPLRAWVEQRIGAFFLKERFDFENTIEDTRRRIGRTFDLDEIASVLMEGLKRSGRMTQASLYLIDSEGRSYKLRASVAQPATPEIVVAKASGLLERLNKEGQVLASQLRRELRAARGLEERGEEPGLESLLEVLDEMAADVVFAVREGDHTYGLLCLRDDRLRDAFTPEDLRLLRGLAGFVAVAVENTRVYEKIKERDRLAAIGEMSAGLAHEIRNPLGSIKAAVQYITEDDKGPDHWEGSRDEEFLDVIIQEVNRLNRVVSSFLDYARPAREDPEPSHVNAILDRTLKLVEADGECDGGESRVELDLQDGLPPVRISDEKLAQVFWNLLINALDASPDGSRVEVRTRQKSRPALWGELGRDEKREFVEITFHDHGEGIPTQVLPKIFIPFYTTKENGTGLGLAISHRIVREAGGTLEVQSEKGKGSTFTVLIPPSPQITEDTRKHTS
jgi:signal transduction histidine kinase